VAEWLLEVKLRPLLHAANHKLWDVCQKLLDMGVSDPPASRYHAAYWATVDKQSQLVANLLASAAHMERGTADASVSSSSDLLYNKSLKDEVLTRALRKAAGNNDLPGCRALVSNAPEVLGLWSCEYAIQDAAHQGYSEVVTFLLESVLHHQGPYAAEQWLHEAFKSAARSRQLSTVQMLLDREKDVNGGASSFSLTSLFGLAIASKSPLVMQMLLKSGAHVHADPDSSSSKSALLYAVERGYIEPVRVLLQDSRTAVGGAELCAAVKLRWPNKDKIDIQAAAPVQAQDAESLEGEPG
jgi:ankyrin repeat protein